MKSVSGIPDDEHEEGSPTQRISAEAVRALYNLDAVMAFSVHGEKHEFKAGARVFVVGRSADCDLVVNVPVASRHHARVIYRKGKFVLVDQSTNGTYVRIHGMDEICLLNGEELPLVGEGVVSLGRPVTEGDADLVTFSVPH
ncbi:FHA domain-containing protein [Ectothiorhodospira shaposhnikovii]|uniref:FHA domain-containing protein n=1 Tax=Ectothiorhodospira shaposhnikovii TaxID=1054 RepID=UPI001EE877E4|nr:FHA domain-containing protein [Ectothiorhodospira shaposhnikovii]MCG5512614.1 FHA domain-containing protein [Ectothiorhodospira shaposhnikovii]